ncbi:KTSC domain-containing protein [Niastella sp. OAS944]
MPSSVVAHMDYYPASATLRITYTSGEIYDYLHVPLKIYEAMKASTAKGFYLNKFIKGIYPYKKVTS